jgi:putative protease
MNYKLWVRLTECDKSDFSYKDINYIIPFWRYDGFDLSDSFYISLPDILRSPYEYAEKLIKEAKADERVKGILCLNIDELMLLKKCEFNKKIVSGPGIYAFNNESIDFLADYSDMYVYPFELSYYELKDLKRSKGILNVYGRTPLMISANCIRKSANTCFKGNGDLFGKINDRKRTDFPVLFQCDSCYNIIYNSLPTSLHEYLGDKIDFTEDIMLSFSDEDSLLREKIIDFYHKKISGTDISCPVKEFTKAYFNHGVD